ncbi:hypothetical protein QTP88_012274 [Uroleucon formosanum]
MRASCVAMKESEVNKLKITYDAEVCDEFIGYGFGRVKTLGRFETVISIDGVSACVMINVVPDDVQEIALLIGHPFTEQPHIMITSTAGKLKVEEIISSDAVNLVSKTPMWANDAVVIPKNHVGPISVNTNFYNEDLCIEGVDYMVKKSDTVTRGEIFTESDITPTAERDLNTEAVQSQEIKSDLDADEVERVQDLLNEHKGLIARNLRQGATASIDKKKKITIELTKVPWKMPIIKVSDKEKLKLMKVLDSRKALSRAFRTWDLCEYPVLPRNTSHSWTVKSSSLLEKPRFVLFGLQTCRKNNIEVDAGRFDHCQLKNLKVHLNSEVYPYDDFRADFKNNTTTILYKAYTDFQKSYYERDYCEPLLSKHIFQNYVLIVVVDLSRQNDNVKSSTVDLRIEFETDTIIPEKTAAYCLILHDQIITYNPFSGDVRKL